MFEISNSLKNKNKSGTTCLRTLFSAMILEGEKKDEAEEDNLENKEKDSKDDGDYVGDQDDQEEKKPFGGREGERRDEE